MTLERDMRGDRERLCPERVAEALGARIVEQVPALDPLSLLLGVVPLPARPSQPERSEPPADANSNNDSR